MPQVTNCRRVPTHRLEREMNQLLSTFFPGSTCGSTGTAPNAPAINAWEDDESVQIELEAPGVKSEQVDISVEGEELSIKIDRPTPQPEGVTYHRRERASGPIARVVRLSDEVDADSIEASLQDGVLTIRLPKVVPEGPRKIEITTAG